MTDENNEPVPVTDSAFIMPAGDVTLSAVIVRLYGVTINITEGSAYGTLTADRTLAAQGDTVTLTVVPAAKYMPVINEETGMPVTVTGSDGENVWVHEDIVWIDEEPTPVPNTYMFTMPASNVTVSAAFVEAAYGINVTYVMEDEFYPSQNGSLAVTADGEPVTKVQGRYLANPDQEIAVTVSPAPEYALVEITGTYDNNYQNISGAALALTQDTSGPNRWTFTMPDGWPYLEARMRKLPVVTFMDGETEYASIPTDETGYVTPPADPTKEGWQFAAWHQVVDGEVSETPFNFNAEITEDITLKAVFDPMYTVTVDDADGGTVTADPETAVAGKAIALDIQPATGYVLTLLSLSDEFGNPATDSNGSPVTVEDEAFIMPANNVIVSAIFDLVSYSIDTHITGEGDVTAYVDGSFANKANYQDTVTLAVEPAEGYMLTSLTCSVDGGDAVAIENGQFTMPAGIVTVTAVFCPVFGDPDFTMPTALTTIEESAFEDLTNMKVVDASNVTTIGKWAFKGCTGLTQIRLDRDCDIDDLAFSGCGTVYVYAPADGETQAYCSKTTNPCVFVETDETLSSITGQEGPVYEFPSGSTLPSILP